MRISKKGEYGVRAMFDLAQHYGEGPIQSHDIAHRQGIDENYLNQILILLRKAKLIDSIRGPQGGHQLARLPEQISLLEVLTVLEGPLMPDEAGSSDAPSASEPVDQELVRQVWGEIRSAIEEVTRNISLDDLCQRKRDQAGEVMYYI
jgi:Rrf2 family cysteine metabolism transcriptional repressor